MGPWEQGIRDTAFQVLLRAARNHLIGQEELALLLAENFSALDPSRISAQSLECFEYFMNRVSLLPLH
jgi:hypothetical protein